METHYQEISPINSFCQSIAVIGGGAIGTGTAWYLAKLGHEIIIIDPQIDKTIHREENCSGSTASLGVLMGYTFHRASGRAWKLRKRSMELWPSWISQLSRPNLPLQLDKPLIKLARSEKEAALLKNLAKERNDLGVMAITNNLQSFLDDICQRYFLYGSLL